jgi:SAM-dependent methyltransferase
MMPKTDASPPIAGPRAPHDDLPFEELSARYNYQLTSNRGVVFVSLLAKELARRAAPRCAVDIGCGDGLSDHPQAQEESLRHIRAMVDELWGIEPDPAIQPRHGLFENFQHATIETAELPPDHFDLAYSYFVMEHVSDPIAFLNAVFRCLKPGGVYLFLTPNGRHYFARIAKLMHQVKLEEWLLRKVVGSHVENYHYPVQYRCNFPNQIRRLAAAAGFAEPDFAFTETAGPRDYFKGPTVALYHLLAFKRRVIRSRGSLLEMFCRLRKPG